MNIEIKISKKPVDYRKAVIFMEKRLDKIREGKARELIWILEHNDIYTAGFRSKKSEILDKKIKVMKTNRGGKITWHGEGQLICSRSKFTYLMGADASSSNKSDGQWSYQHS